METKWWLTSPCPLPDRLRHADEPAGPRTTRRKRHYEIAKTPTTPGYSQGSRGHGRKYARVFLNPVVTTDGRWLLVTAEYGWAKTEIWFCDLRKGDGPLRLLTGGTESQFSAVDAGAGRIALLTAWKARRKRVLLVDLDRPSPENWHEIIPESADSLEGFNVVGGKIYASYLHDVQSQIRIFTVDGKLLGDVPLPSGSSARVEGRW